MSREFEAAAVGLVGAAVVAVLAALAIAVWLEVRDWRRERSDKGVVE